MCRIPRTLKIETHSMFSIPNLNINCVILSYSQKQPSTMCRMPSTLKIETDLTFPLPKAKNNSYSIYCHQHIDNKYRKDN